MSSNNEQVLKTCNTMNDIRKKAEKETTLKQEWNGSLKTITDLLQGRTERVQLKGKAVVTENPASEGEVREFEKKAQQLIHPELKPGKYTKVELEKLDGYREFMDRHCVERNYIFQVKYYIYSPYTVLQKPTVSMHFTLSRNTIIKMSHDTKQPVFRVSVQGCTNRAAQSHKIARG